MQINVDYMLKDLLSCIRIDLVCVAPGVLADHESLTQGYDTSVQVAH